MDKNRTRLTAVAGTTMALVIAGTAAVAAAPELRVSSDGESQGARAMSGAQRGAKAMPSAQRGAKAKPAGPRAGKGGMRGLDEDFERRETVVQTTDGTTTKRVEQGVVDTAAEDSLSFSLASGEAVTVVIDDDTKVYGFEEQEVTRRGSSRTRMAPTEIEVADIEAGAEVYVTSDSEDGADFIASRIIVQPAEEAEDADADEDAEVEEAEADEAEADETAVEEDVTEDAATTDA